MNNQPIIDTTSKQDEYIEILKKHFPSVINQLDDGSYTIDKEQLQLMVEPKNCKIIEDGYGLKWVGKKEAYHNAYIHNNKILKPLVDDSKHFDTTSNILIKGDNLDALKLLKKNYFEKIKMIYIDPPYNTQSDGFIYNDNFTKSQEDVLEELGYSEDQKEYIKNIAGAKTHSGWLSFMYPRLLLARDLLKDDGVIFISIDDNEQANLKLLCDEVFGTDNLETNFYIKVRHENRILREDIRYQLVMEHIICYKKSSYIPNRKEKIKDGNDDYKYDVVITSAPSKIITLGTYSVEVYNRNSYDVIIKDKGFGELKEYQIRGSLISQKGSASEFYELFLRERRNIDSEGALYKVIGMGEKGDGIGYRYIRQPNDFSFKNGFYYQGRPLINTQDKGLPYPNYFDFTIETNNVGYEGEVEFKNGKKPLALLRTVFELSNLVENKNDTIIDFFAGSGTTGDAVMQLNAEDGGNRKFILVQLPEKIDPKKSSEAYKFVSEELKKEPTIFEITAERLRRAGQKILKDNKESKEPKDLSSLDIGFKVYEVADDQYNSIYDKKFNDVSQAELALIKSDDIVKADSLTILTNLLLGSGIALDTKIDVLIADSLYRVDDKLFILKEFDLQPELFNGVEYATIYARYFTNDSFIANLTSFIDKDKIIVKG